MKTITWLYAILFVIIIAGCGTNLTVKPDVTGAKTTKEPPQNVTISVPNWPAYGYQTDDAIVILLVRDPKTFPVPGSIRFNKQDGTTIEMQNIKPEEKKEKPK